MYMNTLKDGQLIFCVFICAFYLEISTFFVIVSPFYSHFCVILKCFLQFKCFKNFYGYVHYLYLFSIFFSRILESISKDLLEDLTKYYCDFIPAMRCRMVTPYSYAPSQQLIDAVNDAHPITPWDNDDNDINTIEEGKEKIMIMKE